MTTTATRYAVRATIDTAEGIQTRTYPCKNATEAATQWADAVDVQTRQGVSNDAVILIDDIPQPRQAETLPSALHTEAAGSQATPACPSHAEDDDTPIRHGH